MSTSYSKKISSLNLKRDNSLTSEELDALKLDKNKLSPEDNERLEYIRKVTAEADELAAEAGFRVDEAVDKPIEDTNWSGQSSLEITRASSNSWSDLLSRKVLVSGDIIAFLLFAVVGRGRHGEDIDVLDVLITASPFIFSWLAISPFFGAFSREATESKAAVPSKIIAGWAASVPVALAIRGVIKGYIPPTPFIVVSLIATYVSLVLWRLLYVLAFGETSNSEYRQAGFLEVFKMVGTLIKRW